MELLGGLGLFLLGMVIMTDGLRSLAGGAIRRWLIKFTRSPVSGAVTGAACTALLQSSSATTVAAVGFVAADLMSFPAALGIIFGANLGTTVTGWMVALIGFKLKLGLLALPLVFVGAVLRLFGRGRLAWIGMSIAGFALIFVGVATMQEAMLNFGDVVVFDQWPGDTLANRLVLVAIGAGFTIIAQSSSAGVAATITALHTGVVDFPQAAALVVGMDVGTTVTALLATVGASANARRTGLSHVIFNVMIGSVALLFIPLYATALGLGEGMDSLMEPEVALVAFHSLFNGLGVIAVLPFTQPFARIMERLVPGASPSYTRSLDAALLDEPSHALDAVHTSAKLELAALLKTTLAILSDNLADERPSLTELQIALDETHAYLDRIHLSAEATPDWQRLVDTIHALDHLQRLCDRCHEWDTSVLAKEIPSELAAQRSALADGIRALMLELNENHWAAAASIAKLTATQIHEKKVPYREAVMRGIGAGVIDVPDGTKLLEVTRWFRRVSKHIERVTAHIGEAIVTQHVKL